VWSVGWKKNTEGATPEFEEAFDTYSDASSFLRDELLWMVIDLPSSDGTGDQAMGAAKRLYEQANRDYYECVGDYIYYCLKSKPPGASGKTGNDG
jgi:hypothetical protein